MKKQKSLDENIGNTKDEAIAKTKKMGLDKILTVSAADYCETRGKKLIDYGTVGVIGYFNGCNVPEGTEVVVDFRPYNVHGAGYGTALIPDDYNDW